MKEKMTVECIGSLTSGVEIWISLFYVTLDKLDGNISQDDRSCTKQSTQAIKL